MECQSIIYSNLFWSRKVSFSYSAGIIHFKGISEQSHVQIVDTKGRIITNKTVNQLQIDFKVKAQGLYLLRINNKDM